MLASTLAYPATSLPISSKQVVPERMASTAPSAATTAFSSVDMKDRTVVGKRSTDGNPKSS